MNGERLKIPPQDTDHHRNSLHAPVVLVEYGDFECHRCGAAEPVLDRIVTEYESNLCLVYRHFPLRNLHPHAQLAALAAEAAARQDSFWRMHHLLFQSQDSLSHENILILAGALELDLEKFRGDMKRGDLLARVQEDFRGGVRSGVTETPGIFINGIPFNEDVEYGALTAAIEDILGHERSLYPPL